MGWVQASRRGRFGPTSSNSPLKQDGKVVAHVEDVDGASDQEDDVTKRSSSSTTGTGTGTRKQFPFAPESLSDDALPFIPKETVLERGKQSKKPLRDQGNNHDGEGKQEDNNNDDEHWIVIDDIVFDCSDFISEHPGGQQVILSFVGEDCSWQFWRLHGKNIMEQYGRALRIGRTEGIKNRFVEPVRYVGLSKLGDDGW
ncbi:uncharacterized protein Z519_10731 [Cladophialophora bantiana CBS 173.52]|uniref:Cytochrome b5 heme-binding domain-containing protein n=1 Tax=Cladophialophora bantiana (strain ATCC 10958 / CBS 173.52 / CDC B-1940 / NIH 8579) TaxID=1442370 RepID=A0A0D2HCP7_CLAB1|nr:uncharacterized protein Z519_10731 [Cladophialophora bantiana CBS 173.52]KIW88685.1 hypothetical protein Z519_10731 [Cladophialophora bantiana CBS 173.52]